MDRLADGTRLLLGLTYLGGAMVHLLFWATDRSVYADITQYVQFDWYRTVWTDLVLPNLGVLLPLLAAFELAVGVAICLAGRRARLGLAAGAAFNLVVAPLGFWWPSNVALAALHGLLLRREFPDSVIGGLALHQGRRSRGD
ncbi:hypothetical protein L593_03750 [Salinarchaeum sp. Harcht-Bsk1]|nr:hypothetical protein L593_03750 [Salinarchaeum sp. Harcht-Bsk1]